MSLVTAATAAEVPIEPAKRPNMKRGEHWTCEEHHQFLRGLDELGRGSWRAISRFYVPSRTAAQVASHAQKYFLKIEGKSASKSSGMMQVLGKPIEAAPSAVEEKREVEITTPCALSSRGEHWTDEEHGQFLLGLRDLGKGAWRDISARYVPSRTPTQVASHSQKYFSKLDTACKKRRSVLPASASASHLQNLVPGETSSGESNSQGVAAEEASGSFRREASGSFRRERQGSYGTDSKRRCLETAEEGLDLPSPMPLMIGASSLMSHLPAWTTAPAGFPSPEDVQALPYWFEALQDLLKDRVPAAKPPTLAGLTHTGHPSRSIDSHRSYEEDASLHSALSGMPPGMFRCTSYTSLDSLASENNMACSSVVRPYVHRASPHLLDRLQPALASAPLALDANSSDDVYTKHETGSMSFQSRRISGSLPCIRKSTKSAFHIVPPAAGGSPLVV